METITHEQHAREEWFALNYILIPALLAFLAPPLVDEYIYDFASLDQLLVYAIGSVAVFGSGVWWLLKANSLCETTQGVRAK